MLPSPDEPLGCSYPALLRKLAAAGAAAAIVGAPVGEDVTEMHCKYAYIPVVRLIRLRSVDEL